MYLGGGVTGLGLSPKFYHSFLVVPVSQTHVKVAQFLLVQGKEHLTNQRQGSCDLENTHLIRGNKFNKKILGII